MRVVDGRMSNIDDTINVKDNFRTRNYGVDGL